MNKYLKFIVAALDAAGIALETGYPHATWSMAITAGIGAVLVYLVPNAPKGQG